MTVQRKSGSYGMGNLMSSRTGGLAILAMAAAVLVMTAPQAVAQFNRSPNMPTGPSMRSGPQIHSGPRISIHPSVRLSPNWQYEDPVRRRAHSSERHRAKPPQDSGNTPRQRTTRRNAPAAANNSYVPKEVLLEVDGNLSETQKAAIARRHRLSRVEAQDLPLLGSTLLRWRIRDNRSVDSVIRALVAENDVRSVQRNAIFRLQQHSAVAAASANGPVQYALTKLRLPQAHELSTGADVRVAVIDSGIDLAHPEFASATDGVFDALGGGESSEEKAHAHAHGTSIAGIIMSRGRLTGTAPAARLLAVRAFGARKSGAVSNSFVILKGLDYAVSHGARIINMSFAGPHDPAIERGLAAAAARNIVLIAAAGNAGPKSPPLYPAADRNVIAVTATDLSDRLFAASNRGPHVAIAAPGVDILAPLPGGKYGLSSGTSLSAAYVSGVAALMIARDPDLTPNALRHALTSSARDLGPKGRDDAFGAGEADAYAAVSAIAVPVATASEQPKQP